MTTQPPRDTVDMGTYADAEAAFMAKVDAWIALRQPIMANAAALKKRDVQEREATFQLANAAAFLGWHIRNRLTTTSPSSEYARGVEDAAKVAEAKIINSYWDRINAVGAILDLSPTPTQPQEGLVPDGWVMVPREPTPRMIDAADGLATDLGYEPAAATVWSAMLAAAPKEAK